MYNNLIQHDLKTLLHPIHTTISLADVNYVRSTVLTLGCTLTLEWSNLTLFTFFKVRKISAAKKKIMKSFPQIVQI